MRDLQLIDLNPNSKTPQKEIFLKIYERNEQKKMVNGVMIR